MSVSRVSGAAMIIPPVFEHHRMPRTMDIRERGWATKFVRTRHFSSSRQLWKNDDSSMDSTCASQSASTSESTSESTTLVSSPMCSVASTSCYPSCPPHIFCNHRLQIRSFACPDRRRHRILARWSKSRASHQPPRQTLFYARSLAQASDPSDSTG